MVPEFPSSFETSIDVSTITRDLQASGFEWVDVSNDAGEYICNYLYYKSSVILDDCADVLLVHVPLFKTIPEEVQLRTLDYLVTLLSNRE